MTAEAHVLEPPMRGKHHKRGRQRALIGAATCVFAEHGFDGATTREVAERSGCSEGLIHRYFGGKRGLLLAVLESRRADAVAEFQTGVPECDDPQEEIEGILLWSIENIWQRRDFMRVSVSQAAIDPAIGRMVGDRLNSERVQLISERLERHRAAGGLRGDTDVALLAEAISAMGFAFGFFGRVAFERDRNDIEAIARAAAAALCRGVAAAPVGARTRRARRVKDCA